MTKYLPVEALPVEAVQFRNDGKFIDELKKLFPKGEYALMVRFTGDVIDFPVNFNIEYRGETYNFTVTEPGSFLVVKPDELLLLSKQSFFEDYAEVEEPKKPPVLPPYRSIWPPYDPTTPMVTWNGSDRPLRGENNRLSDGGWLG